MSSKVYLIDTENVKSEWKSVLDKLGKKDKLLIFYTENSPNVSFADFSNLVNYPFRYDMIPCYLGKNGLDFQLVSWLGYLLRRHPLWDYVILSNDTGYDAVVYFWSGKGKKVSRLSTESLHGEKAGHAGKTKKNRSSSGGQRKKENTGKRRPDAEHTGGQKRKNTSRRNVRQRSPEKIQQDVTLKMKEILEVQKGIDFSWLYGELQKYDMDHLQELNQSMVKKWGQEEGTALYRKLKPRVKEIYQLMKE